jgi:cytochrome o ubiquinol oxidase subunit 2
MFERRTVKRIIGAIVLLIVIAAVVVGANMLLRNVNIDVLNPQGEIAVKERNLIFFTLLLSSVVVVPVFALLIVFSLRYNATNKRKGMYRPNWDGNRTLETIWWGIPCAIILILGVVTWQTSHELDPYKHLDSNVQPLNVQVVSLQWKWLFVYPDLGVASVNLLQIPVGTPVNFSITSDAPMNSFWVPSLGGQVYAMTGMSTKLSLVADHTGDFKGSSANISGKGFSDMKFIARSSSRSDFDAWVKGIQNSKSYLDMTSYTELAKPATIDQPVFYALSDGALYDKIVAKYMTPMNMEGM